MCVCREQGVFQSSETAEFDLSYGGWRRRGRLMEGTCGSALTSWLVYHCFRGTNTLTNKLNY